MKLPQTTFLGIALLLSGLTLCGFGLWLLLSPPQYQATVRMEIESFGTDISSLGTSRSFDPYFVQTTFEIIKSEFVLGNVITNLNLNEIWGKKYNGGNMLETAQTLRRLQPHLQFESFPDARVIKISFTDDDANEAAKIVNAIATAYKKYRISLIVVSTGIELETLQRQYDLEENQIKIMQANLDLLREKYKINQDDETGFEYDRTHTFTEFGTSMTPAQQEKFKKYEPAKPFWEEKDKLDQMLEQHRLLSLKLAAAKVDAVLPMSSVVQIMDFAVPPKYPLPRNYPFAISLFGIGLFPSVAGWLLLKSSRQPTG